MSEKATCTRREFADMLGVRPSYVTKLGKADRLVLSSDGRRVVIDASLARIEATRDPSRATKVSRGDPPSAGSGLSEREEAPPAADPSFTAARTKREHYAALKAETEYLQLAGRLCDAEAVKNAGSALGTRLRTLLERWGDRLPRELASCNTEDQIRAVVADEVDAMLNDLADELSRGVDRIGEGQS